MKNNISNIDRAKNTLTACLDQFGDDTVKTAREAVNLILDLIDTLGSYPKPREAKSETPAPDKILGAYLYTSTARNALKLGHLGYMKRLKAIATAKANIEIAYSLLVD